MPKRKSFLDNADDPFGNDSSEGESLDTFDAVDSAIFGDFHKAESKITRLKKVNIFSIQPDLKQPRRTMPSIVRARWNGTGDGLEQAFAHWLQLVEDERNSPLLLDPYFADKNITNDDPGLDDDHIPGPLEQALLAIVTLAASIHRDGLMNPISVAEQKRKNTYMLETGERRWLAFHLLHLWFDGSSDERPDKREDYQEIPCQTVDEINVWRQANENNARENLNAIGKARQYAVLLMDLVDQDFAAINQFDHERDFYAQVTGIAVPYGKSKQLLASMGVTNRSALSRYRKLLDLPTEIWEAADDRSLPVEQLVNLAKLATDKSPEHAIQRFKGIVAGRNNSARDADYGPGTRRHFTQLTSSIQKAGRGKKDVNQQALKAMRELREWLDMQEDLIRKYLD